MIKIHPTIDFTARCPKDESELEVKEVLIPGMRCLADVFCPTCSSRYYMDLPVSHALYHPVTLDLQTAEIYAPKNIEWFSEPLRDSYLNPELSTIIPKVHKFFETENILILNCLDYLYGHSLLKLLNVQRYLEHNPELGCCVLVPTSLVHLVPVGVAEIWEFPISFKEGKKWYTHLQKWIKNQIENRQECYLSPAYSHPSHQIYDLDRFVHDLPDLSQELKEHEPIVLFSYREDRLWGKTVKSQERNIQRLYDQLGKIFPEIAFILVGFGSKNQFKSKGKKLIDLRIDKFDIEIDRKWLAYMQNTDCAIGVHGSNMLLPSGLSKSIVELVPRERLGNIYQDILFPHDLSNIRDAFLRYRFIYGKNHLSDVTPENIIELFISMYTYNQYNSCWFSFGENNQSVYDDIKSLDLVKIKNINNYLPPYVNKVFDKIKTSSAYY
ncbi:MAG: hypothetical protein N5P05_003589 [Chroococcopsis gigantea SAG 12.99]|nr:hypothetical protein [Chroococcopsis gigantea SAG 12.99]